MSFTTKANITTEKKDNRKNFIKKKGHIIAHTKWALQGIHCHTKKKKKKEKFMVLVRFRPYRILKKTKKTERKRFLFVTSLRTTYISGHSSQFLVCVFFLVSLDRSFQQRIEHKYSQRLSLAANNLTFFFNLFIIRELCVIPINKIKLFTIVI